MRIAEIAALAALRGDLEWIGERVREAVTSRNMLMERLDDCGYPPLESKANFVLVPVHDSARVESRMRTQGIAVRRFDNLTSIGDAIRIGVGPWPVMERCVDAFRTATS